MLGIAEHPVADARPFPVRNRNTGGNTPAGGDRDAVADRDSNAGADADGTPDRNAGADAHALSSRRRDDAPDGDGTVCSEHF